MKQNQNSFGSMPIIDHSKGDYGLLVLVHELRNPISCVIHAAQILKQSDPFADPEAHRWAVAALERQVGRIASMVDDLQQTSRSCKLRNSDLPCVDAASIIDNAMESVGPLIHGQLHTLKCAYQHGQLWFRVDPRQIEQVLVNLLTNAARYTPDGGHILVSCARVDDFVEISVADNGIGIVPDEIDAIFGLFGRASAAREKVKDGWGVGLAVVQELVQRNGGTVEVYSAGIDRGTTFTVRIPFQEPPRVETSAYATLSPNQHLERILIVDDNRDLVGALQRLLRRRGHAVECAFTGAGGLQLAGKFQPSLCLVDIDLP